MRFFKIISILTSVLFVYLFFVLFIDPDSFLNDIGLQSSQTASIVGRRATIFMLGISVLMFGSRNLPHSKARQIICLSTGITMLGLACMGSMEFIRGTVNTSIFTSIIIETTLGISFAIIFLKNIKTIIVQ